MLRIIRVPQEPLWHAGSASRETEILTQGRMVVAIRL